MKKLALVKKIMACLHVAVLLLFSCMTAYAEVSLPDGVVAGLPEGLTAMDDAGNVVSASTGIYFFEVEDMIPNIDYTKKIQLMNLRTDKAYHIYFYVEPVDKEGNIDLENECSAVFTMGDKEIFKGKVNGEPQKGFTDLREEPYDLGLYKPGQSDSFTCTINWDGNYDMNVDYGERLYDVDGEHIIRPSEPDIEIHGQVRFKWIFYAVVEEEYVPPKTGIESVGFKIFFGASLVLIVIIGSMLYIISKKKKRNWP